MKKPLIKTTAMVFLSATVLFTIQSDNPSLTLPSTLECAACIGIASSVVFLVGTELQKKSKHIFRFKTLQKKF